MSPPSQSTTHKGRYKSLLEIVSTDDVVGILIVADPSSGGHKGASRAEIPISALTDEPENSSKIIEYMADKIKNR